MNLYEIKSAYQQGVTLDEINQLYTLGLDHNTLDDDEQLELWQQVCAFCNSDMIDYLIGKGWRPMAVKDRYDNTLLHFMAAGEFSNSYVMSEGQIYKTTKKLLENKVSAIKKNTDGETALMLGAKNGFFEMLFAYHETGAKLDWVNGDGETILHLAARNSGQAASELKSAEDNLENLEKSTFFDADSRRDNERKAGFEWKYQMLEARLAQFIQFINLCIEYGLDPQQKNNLGETAVDVAVKAQSKIAGAILAGADLSDPEMLTLNLQAGGQDIFQASINRDLDAIIALAKLGTNLDEAYDKEGDRYNQMTPLSIAVTLHDFELVNALCSNSANVMLLDSQSWHPLKYLYEVNSTINTCYNEFENQVFQKILNSFVQAGFDINMLLDDEENTLLSISAKNADRLKLYNNNSISKSIIGEAVYAGADVNKTNKKGVSVLMYLCSADSSRAENEIGLILEQGASTDLTDMDGKTALIYASNNPEKSTAKTYCELLDSFGDILVTAKDNSGKTALDYAAEKNNENLVNWLLEKY